MKVVLLYGNPNNGFSYIGPFLTRNEAADFAEEMGFFDATQENVDEFILFADIETPEEMNKRLYGDDA